MAIALKLSDDLVEMAKPHAAAEHRSVPKRVFYKLERQARIVINGLTQARPVFNLLLAAQEAKAGMLTPYQFGA